MRSPLKFAFALSVATLPLQMAPAPAIAQSAKAKLKLSPDFAKAYRGAAASLAAAEKAEGRAAKAKKPKDKAKYQNAERTAMNKAKAAWPALKAKIANDDDRYQAAIFAAEIMEPRDVEMRKDAVAFALASKATSAADRLRFTFESGVLALEAKDYANAQKIMLDSYNAGYRGGDADLHISDSFNALGNQGEAFAWLKRYIESTNAAKTTVDPRLYARGMNYAIRTGASQEVDYWARLLVSHDPRPEAWHDALLQVSRHSGLSAADSLDLMRLMRKAGGMMFEEDYLLYLQLLDKRRHAAEALAVIDAGTGKARLPRNNLAVREARGEASIALPAMRAGRGTEETAAKAASNGYPALQAGDTALSFADYAKAKALYETAINKGGLADPQGVDQGDRAQIRLAIALLHLGDTKEAKAELAKVKPGTARIVADYWAIYADQKLHKSPTHKGKGN